MTAAAPPVPVPSTLSPPPGWDALRASGDIQFAPVTLPETPPRAPSGFELWLQAVFEWLGRVLGPLAEWLGAGGRLIGWLAVAGLAALALALVWRALRQRSLRRGAPAKEAEASWQPARAQTLALLAEADRLAGEGRFDEATHLLLTRSVGEMAAARPGAVEPSSTARELAALPWLPPLARSAFVVIAERVERSRFALERLTAEDWERARAAYARFAAALPDSTGSQGARA